MDTISNYVRYEIEVWGRTHACTDKRINGGIEALADVRQGFENKTFVMIVLGGEGGSFA